MDIQDRREGDDFVYEAGDIRVVIGGVRESSGDLSGIVRAFYLNGRGPQPLMAPSRLNLVAPRSRTEVARAIAARGQPADMDAAVWGQVLEYVCGRTYTLWERGDPVIDLSDVVLPPWSGRYALEPLLPDGETTVIFADGGSGKSTLATALAASVMLGVEVVPGVRPAARRQALYLDWESNVYEHTRRLDGLCRGINAERPGMLYRTNYRALADDLATFRGEVARRGVGFVVVDSAVPASGDEIKDTAAPRQLFNALRSLGDGVTRLVLAHMSKAEAEREQGRARALGSVMYENLARSVWELRRSENSEDGALVIGLFHRKMNGGRLRQPFALLIRYDAQEQPYLIERTDIRSYPDLAERLPVGDRLHDLLRSGARSTADIAGELGKGMRATLLMLKRRSDVIQLSAGGKPGQPAMWGLRGQQEDEWWNE